MEAAFVAPLVCCCAGGKAAARAKPCTQSLVRGASVKGFPAAEQLDCYFRKVMRDEDERVKREKDKRGKGGGAGRPARCAPLSRRADCFVEVCPRGTQVVLHPRF